VNLTVNLKQVTFLYQINTGWAVCNKRGQFQSVYETLSVPQSSRSIPERPLLEWAVCNAQEMLWRRRWSYNWRSTLAIHPVPHKLHKLSNWRQITQLKKSFHTEHYGEKRSKLTQKTEALQQSSIAFWRSRVQDPVRTPDILSTAFCP
jgi:hypothetical protein